MNDFIPYLNVFSGSLMLLLIFSRDMAYLPFILRIGFGLLAVGLLSQSVLMWTETDRYQGIGTMWALKDVGAAIVSFTWTWMAIANRMKKAEEVTRARVTRARGRDDG